MCLTVNCHHAALTLEREKWSFLLIVQLALGIKSGGEGVVICH